jgi:hypothetical protein
VAASPQSGCRLRQVGRRTQTWRWPSVTPWLNREVPHLGAAGGRARERPLGGLGQQPPCFWDVSIPRYLCRYIHMASCVINAAAHAGIVSGGEPRPSSSPKIRACAVAGEGVRTTVSHGVGCRLARRNPVRRPSPTGLGSADPTNLRAWGWAPLSQGVRFRSIGRPAHDTVAAEALEVGCAGCPRTTCDPRRRGVRPYPVTAYVR